MASSPSNEAAQIRGPLRVCEENPRYFTDGTGKAVYLTGSHTWNNLIDSGTTDPPPAFDYTSHLDFLKERHHNLIRLWTSSVFRYQTRLWQGGAIHHFRPSPWLRAGPGKALDGKPRFDLTRFDESYFERLRSRTVEAGKLGFYVSVMLFEGWAIDRTHDQGTSSWEGHALNGCNNINGIDGDPEGTGRGHATNTLKVPAVTRVQEAYVRKVIDTVNDLDNVLYEISNEAIMDSTEWQYHLIEMVKEYEAGKPKQHPVGMTCQLSLHDNRVLFASPADWISPPHEAEGDFGYKDNPPPSDGRKVILADTDHMWGVGGDVAWVWKSFCRSVHPIFMDDMDDNWEPVRRNMGYALRFAERMELVRMRPMGELASSGYCLANPGQEYLVYLPQGGKVSIDLRAAAHRVRVEWFNPVTGETTEGTTVAGGGRVELGAPFAGEGVLYLAADGRR